MKPKMKIAGMVAAAEFIDSPAYFDAGAEIASKVDDILGARVDLDSEGGAAVGVHMLISLATLFATRVGIPLEGFLGVCEALYEATEIAREHDEAQEPDS